MSGEWRPRVLVLDPIHEDAVKSLQQRFLVRIRFQPTVEELLGMVDDVDAIVVRSGCRLPAELFVRARRLRTVVRAGTGTDNIDLDAARAAGVIVCTVPGSSTSAVAELAIGLVLAAARKIALADRQIRAGIWDKPNLLGIELAGSRFGVVGLGKIGTRIAELAIGFSAHVLGTVARPNEARRADFGDRGVELADLSTVLRLADVICLSVPLTPETLGLIGAAELALMKPSAILVNMARGGVVDETALEAALRSGTLGAAALDVHEHEGAPSRFRHLDTVVLTPHIGAMSVSSQRRIGQNVVESVVTALAGLPVPNRVC